jgi:hypothetical protein
MSDNKKLNSQNIDDLGSSKYRQELINDSELAELIQELELSPEELDAIAGGEGPPDVQIYGTVAPL